METAGNKKYLKLIRCDDKDALSIDRVVEDKEYLAWDKVIADTASRKQELYFSMNSFYGERKTERLHSLQNCWVDVDKHDGEVSFKTAKNFCKNLIWRLQHDELPIPYCVFSGRGIHLFWPIIPCGKQDIAAWSCIQKNFIQYVENLVEELDYMTGWEVDKKVQDVARIMRVPGTFNRTARTWTRFIPSAYSAPCTITELCAALQISEAEKKKEKKTIRHQPVERTAFVSETDVSAAEQRYLALIEFAQGRNMELEGIRNAFTTVLASTLAALDPANAKRLTLEFCKQLKPAQSTSEIIATINCCLRAKYKWKNETIAERLGMTEIEYSRFTIIHTKQARLSALKKRTTNRTRNENRAQRKKKKTALYNQIPILWIQGFSYSDIAKQLGISISTVKRHAPRLVKCSQNRLVRKYRNNKIKKTVAHIREGCVSVCTLLKPSAAEVLVENGAGVCCADVGGSIFLKKSVSKGCVNKYSIGPLLLRAPHV